MRTPEEALRAYLEHLRALGRSPKTLTGRRGLLGHFLRWFRGRGHGDITETSETLLENYLLEEARRKGPCGNRPLSPGTLETKAYALRGFFGFLLKRGVLLGNPALTLSRGRRRPVARAVPTREEVLRLLDAPGRSRAGLRDRAILEMFYSTGMRCAELCNLDLSSVDRTAGVVWVRKGKGGDDRVVPVGARALEALRLYLEKSRPAFKPSTPALFVAQGSGRRLSPADAAVVVKGARRKAGLETPVTPHSLRHAFATHLLENGAGIRHVQAMLGHASIKSTQVYTRVNPRRLKEELARHDTRAGLGEENPPPAPPPPRWAKGGKCLFSKPSRRGKEEPSSI